MLNLLIFMKDLVKCMAKVEINLLLPYVSILDSFLSGWQIFTEI